MMYQFKNIAEAIGANKYTANACFQRITTDTRTLQQGDVFVALRGPHFNGHKFVTHAQQKGAVGALVSTEIATDLPQMLVSDTRIGLAALARLRRANMSGIWLAVTGSSGKTTVKEMLGQILAQAGSVETTQGNFNNDIGVPTTIWQMQAQNVAYRVLELGASQLGEIAHTCGIVAPQVSILNNAQEAHLAGFGSHQAVVEAKGEIITGLAADGQVVLNRDDASFAYWQSLAGSRQVWCFSIDNTRAQVHAKHIVIGAETSRFVLCIGNKEAPVQLAMPGQHNVANALAAAAAAAAVGLSITQIQAGLAQCHVYKGRLLQHQLPADVLVIDDTYNANPASVRAAIDVLQQQSGKRCLILGEVQELGQWSCRLHEDLGRYAAQAGIEYLIGVGPKVAAAVSQYVAGGGKHAIAVEAQQDIKPYLATLPKQGLSFLVKGSRSSRMERVVEQLLRKDL